MKIRLNKSECMDDWYTIVRAEHDGLEWMERTGPHSWRLMMSERLTPEACIEGSGFEMLELAHAIKSFGAARFKRCAVNFDTDGVHFCSPKNSERDAIVSFFDADEFANIVITELMPKSSEIGKAISCKQPDTADK